jgi:DNA-binding MarR family transcriptional regulator
MLELADQLGVTRGGLTGIIDRLIRRGWLERDRPEYNRREVYAVAEQGHQARASAQATYIAVLGETIGTHLGERDVQELGRITCVLLRAMTSGACS